MDKSDTTISSALGLNSSTAVKVGLPIDIISFPDFIPTLRSTGLAKAIMRDHQQTAQAANLPIWLEATTPRSRDLYLSMGFEEIEEIVLGKGKVAVDSSLQPGGPGVPLWAMVWWPKSTSDSVS